jgi:putative transposase
MAKKRFTAEQIVAILREAEKAPTNEEVLRKHSISQQTFYRWKKMYANLGVAEVQRIKQLEKENRQLKQLAGDQALAIQVLKEFIKKKGSSDRPAGNRGNAGRATLVRTTGVKGASGVSGHTTLPTQEGSGERKDPGRASGSGQAVSEVRDAPDDVAAAGPRPSDQS